MGRNMKYRQFGRTDLKVSEIGFGAWGIGGPAMAGDIPIGWGEVEDKTSIEALAKSHDLGINFYDTADFYGLGHSEEIIGTVFGNKKDVIIATKVGHKLANDNSILLDYSKKHILESCENSLKRLKRDAIDYYQLHSAKLDHLYDGECIEAMEQLKKEGKIRYWGISLNTFNVEPEGNFFIQNKIGDGFQLVLNIINQKAAEFCEKANENGYGIIARMPLQFGLLTGKFDENSRFPEDDHRHFRLTPEFLSRALGDLEEVWQMAEKYGVSKTSLSLSFILKFKEVSTIIPGIKTPAQAELNTKDLIEISDEDFTKLRDLYSEKLKYLVDDMV